MVEPLALGAARDSIAGHTHSVANAVTRRLESHGAGRFEPVPPTQSMYKCRANGIDSRTRRVLSLAAREKDDDIGDILRLARRV